MPPDCYVCHLTLHDVLRDGKDYFTLVRFGATQEARWLPAGSWTLLGVPGIPATPSGSANEQLPLARAHEDEHLDDALAAIKEDPRYGRRGAAWRAVPMTLTSSAGSLVAVPRERLVSPTAMGLAVKPRAVR
jgi:hypothetical protein